MRWLIFDAAEATAGYSLSGDQTLDQKLQRFSI
jgi:hypothetical protein